MGIHVWPGFSTFVVVPPFFHFFLPLFSDGPYSSSSIWQQSRHLPPLPPSFASRQYIAHSFTLFFFFSPPSTYVRFPCGSPIIRKGERDETEKKNGWPRNCPSMQSERCLSPSFTLFTQDVGNSTLNVHTVYLYPIFPFSGKGAPCFDLWNMLCANDF